MQDHVTNLRVGIKALPDPVPLLAAAYDGDDSEAMALAILAHPASALLGQSTVHRLWRIGFEHAPAAPTEAKSIRAIARAIIDGGHA